MAASIDLSFLTVQVLSALRQAAFLFLISSGLTLIFGVLNILNFAHGALYMLGAYFIYALTLHLTGPAGFLIALLAAPLGVAVIAAAIETGLLRRIYVQEEIYQLLLTYSLVLIIDDLAKIVFGPEYKSIPKPDIISGAVVVVVMGGLGNLWGALIGSILIGTLETVGIIVFPEFEMSLIYLLMVAILVVRPWGLFGRPLKVKALSDKNLSMEAQEISPVHFSIHPAIRLIPLVLLLIVPLVAGRFYQFLLTQILIASLVAVAFNLLLGTTGLLSFGQMAFYGVGAYTFGLLVMKAGFGTLPALLLSPIFAALVAGVIGFFCVRLSGVHFAMLTLAFGQLVYTIAFKWYGFTGGDNGIQGIPIRPLPWGIDIGSTKAMYYFALAVVGISVECLRRIRSSPFGATLKATRENSQRAAYLGVNVKLYQWTAFVIAGAFTGLAGGLYAVMEKAITPDIIHWTKSGEPVFMTVIGGIYTFAGPVVGAAVFVVLNSYLVAWTEDWALVLGIILLVMVLMLPGGVVGFINEKARGALSKRGWVRKW